MKHIILKKDGFHVARWNGETRQTDVSELPKDLRFLTGWTHKLEIQEEITLQDLVNIMGDLEPETNTLIELITDSNVLPYLEEIDKEQKEREEPDNISYIEIYKTLETSEFEGNKYTYDGVCAHGIGKEKIVDEFSKEPYLPNYGLEFTPWNELKDKPIRFGHATLTMPKGDHDYEVIDNLEYDFTMGDFFLGLFNELCFFGHPEDRDEQLDELKERVEECKNGTAEYVEWDDLKKELEERLDKKE
jgi:hypothetical protein